ncbi:receptor-interacting serine/threonine-protein kinase 3-like isoform X2 [Xyrauchen texanus]|uniref:receptor-interacting serine/threonine-protein kinase 3-like isoform X2 n=1 Tax=Xyrauchen texanus TaxID=154827 RepID=UPI002241D12D|nr:receptor-interacting serine/threonine-protein kinase 3-like isoform X2 [Xyrauchen texanus]
MDGLNRLRSDLIRDDSLDGWTVIGCGGFGQIYRAKHKGWGFDVAIKLLLNNDGSTSSLQKEANLMLQARNPNVLWIYGLYEGRLGDELRESQVGLVMEYMSRGALSDLLKVYGPLPWPLTFRITHQIGLGMNFLHKLDPPLLHLDLKPGNVLLDDSLNAKLTDFGLSRVARSLSKSVREKDEVEGGGTLSYMPPEALKSVNYKPNNASDIYSYGVLLWSICTGREPYLDTPSSLVRFRIPQGDRPELTSIDCSKAKSLDKIVKLISTCWAQEPNQRPTFRDCVHVTEKVFDIHKHGVNKAVHDVLKKLNGDICSGLESVQITPKPQNVHPRVLSGATGPSPQQDAVASQNTEGIKKESFPHPVMFEAPHRNKTTPRQSSTPDFLSGGVSINLSNVSGVQLGNNNYMNITHRSRQRHRTAPSSINGSHDQSENSYKKTESQPHCNNLPRKEKK